MKEKYRICKNFRQRTQKKWDIRLKALLMEATLRPVLEPSCSNSTPSKSVLVWIAPPALSSFRHCSPSLVPKKFQKKQRSCSLAPSKEGNGVVSKRPCLGCLPSPDCQRATSLSGHLSPPRDLTPGSGRGPRHLIVPLTPEAFQVARDLMALPAPWPAGETLKVPPSKGKTTRGPPQGTMGHHQSLEERHWSMTPRPQSPAPQP